MFKVNSKDTKTMSIIAAFSSVSFVDFEKVNAQWELITV